MANFSLTATDIKDKVTLKRTVNPMEFQFVDETTWGTSGVDGLPPVTLRWRTFKITVDGTVVYDNLKTSTSVGDWDGTTGTADMLASVTTFDSATLPKNSSDNSFIDGNYKIEINTLYKTADTGSTYVVVSSEITHDLSYDKPTGDITTTVDLNFTNPQLQSIDTTNYIVDGVTPTISRAFIYYPPQGSGGSQVSTSAKSITLSSFYTGTSVFQLTSSNTATWDFSSKINTSATNTYTSGNFTLLLFDSVTKREEFKVQDDIGLCGVICCIKDLYRRITTAVGNGDQSLVNQLNDDFNYAMSRVAYLQAGQSCDETDDINNVITDIKNRLECGGDCGCDGDEPTLISPLGQGNTTNNTIIKFNTASVSSSNYNDGSATGSDSTYTNGLLADQTFNDTTRTFRVFADGVYVTNGSLSGSTFTFDAQYLVADGVDIVILFN